MMQHYPIAVCLQGKECVVVGGGAVANRKVEALLACGACVRVVSPVLGLELQGLVVQGKIQHQEKNVDEADLRGAFLVIGATDQREVNRQVGMWASAQNVLVNIVDQPEDCNFIVPAVHRAGSLTLTVSTDGKSPALAARIKRELAEQYSDSYAMALDWLGEIRAHLMAHLTDRALRRQMLLEVVEGEWLVDLQAGEGEKALQWLKEHVQEIGDEELLWTRLHTIWEERRDG